MGKRHNRKRTRSRLQHRHAEHGNQKNRKNNQHTRSDSMDSFLSSSSSSSCSSLSTTPFELPIQHSQYPTASAHLAPVDHWQQTYLAWQNRIRIAREQEWAVEMQQLRIFGGVPGEEGSLLAPMLKVVTDLFDGLTDYEDP